MIFIFPMMSQIAQKAESGWRVYRSDRQHTRCPIVTVQFYLQKRVMEIYRFRILVKYSARQILLRGDYSCRQQTNGHVHDSQKFGIKKPCGTKLRLVKHFSGASLKSWAIS